jgi:Nuclease-related domain
VAQTIPDKCPSKIKGEQRLFGILKRLPDDAIVYYEPVIDNRHPDFVIILPTLGVLLIEVKGWYRTNILEGNPIRSGFVRVHSCRCGSQVKDKEFAIEPRFLIPSGVAHQGGSRDTMAS